ncbi:MAG: hypothetical protein Q9197_005159 [Variospora fuerteventurae]
MLSSMQRRNRSTPPSSTLITYIRKRDDLPRGWTESKRKRRSAGDIQPLGQFMERQHGISQPLEAVRVRRASAPTSNSTTNTRSRFLRWDTIALPESVKRRLDSTIGALGGKQSSLVSARKRWWTSTAPSRRQATDLGIKLMARYNALPHLQPIAERRRLGWLDKELAFTLFAGLREVLEDVWSILRILLRFTWYFLRLPCCSVLAILLGLQIIAMLYTITSTAFLASFCQYKLPLVRNWVCSERDLVLLHRQVPPAENLNQPLGNILQSNERTISYELPHLLSRYETSVRTFRVSLPESEYTASDQAYFRGKFTEFIDQSGFTILAAQLFHAHIVGTINAHVSDTRYVVDKLNDYGLMSPSKINHNGFLADTMAWLEFHYLVYLPVGIEPFQETSIQTYNNRHISLMERHVQDMSDRLAVDIDMVITLQKSLWKLGSISEEIANRISYSKSSDAKESHEREGKPMQWISEVFFGKTFENYQIDQRSKWLGTMGPMFQDAGSFLYVAGIQLTSARTVCQELLERLAIDGRAVKYGWELPEWVGEQAKELDVGIGDLETQLKAFKIQEMNFDDRVFRQE